MLNLCRISVAVVMFGFVSFQHLAIGQDDSKTPGIAGMWEGLLKVQGAELNLQFLIEKDDDGKLNGKMISVDQGGAEVPYSAIKFEEGKLEIELKQAMAKYEAKLNDAGDKLDGTFSQVGTDYDLKLKRGTATAKLSHFETWRGEMNAGGKTFDFQMRLFKGVDGKISGKLDSFSEGAMGLKLDVEMASDGLEFELDLTKAKYSGKFGDKLETLNGKWMQSGGEYELNFEKVPLDETQTEVKLDRPQTPKEPFPYNVEDVKFRNDNEDIELAGTLTTPKTTGLLPVVVLISGSGPQDRDETILGHKPFLVLADYLTRKGIAVLRFDERGVGESSGDFSTATSEDFANDVEAAIQFCTTRNELDASKIGLIGHSEGGYVAPMVAARNDQVAFIVLLAGPGVTGAEILQTQTRAGSKLIGLKDSTLDAQDEFVTSYVGAMLASDGKIDAEKGKEIIKKYEEAVLGGTQFEQIVAKQLVVTMKALDSKWTRFFLKHDPKTDLRNVKCPVLAINGSKDVQVDADVNLTAIKEALTEGGNKDFEIKKIDNLNHLFQNAETGAGSEYATITETFAPNALLVIGEWIRSRVR